MNNFKKHQKSYRKEAIIQRYMRARILRKARELGGEIAGKKLLEIGANQGELARAWPLEFASYTAVDINNMSEYFDNRFQFIQADANDLSALAECELVVSNACFQWLNLPRALANLRIKSGSHMLITSFLPGNLKQIQKTFGAGLVYPSQQALRRIFSQRGFEVLELQARSYLLRFSSPLALLRHIKYSGCQLERAQYISRAQLARLGQQLSYKTVFIHARKL